MKRALRSTLFAAALGMGVAPAAHAATLVNGQFCGGNNFATCAFINSSSATSGGVTTLTLVVTNPAGNNAGSVFTDIGIANLPAGASAHLAGGTSSDPNFLFAPDGPHGLIGAGIGGDVAGFEAKNPQPKNGLTPGETVTFVFTFNGVYDLSAIQYAFHDQGGAPRGCQGSTKLVVARMTPNGAYVANDNDCGPVYTPPPVTTAPEPASMTLLATGLAGIGGIVRRRGRKQSTAAV